MNAPVCDDGRMRTLVGFLALDRLADAERDGVLAHLETCEACRAERDEVERIVAILGRLSPDDVRDLITEFGPGPAAAARAPLPGDELFGAPGAPRPALVAAPPRTPPLALPAAPVPPAARPVVPAARAVPESRPAIAAPPRIGVGEGYLPPRPATGPLARGPHSHRRARRTRLRAAVGLSGALVVALGAVLVIRPWGTADELGPIAAVAATADDASGMGMNAVIYQEDGQASVRLTADGLAPDTRYQLYVVTGDGEELLLGQLSGEAGGGTYTGDIAVPVDDLWYFTVRQVDGSVMISANVVMGSPGPSEGAGK
ncbi:zf-HC2 domain-containing protein [Catenuloplanes atrovinosus]|uniref:Zinc-finger domain-containing protein n=1 Tax=Catenuloplanes atrovinosus TaxID=137266 RepID=A0AAE4C844_9ACTN|nr:zf-HC2 domain-containing protein [Catenuloplanes atrovinosus]MDR7274257.1 hypothetical protein [Catenuloplanes atrovinosus]